MTWSKLPDGQGWNSAAALSLLQDSRAVWGYLLFLESSGHSSKVLHNFLSKPGHKSWHILHLHVEEQAEKQWWKLVCEGCLSEPVTSLQQAVMRTRVYLLLLSSTNSGALSCFSESGINHITSDSRSVFEMCLQISLSVCQQSAQVMLLFAHLRWCKPASVLDMAEHWDEFEVICLPANPAGTSTSTTLQLLLEMG